MKRCLALCILALPLATLSCGRLQDVVCVWDYDDRTLQSAVCPYQGVYDVYVSVRHAAGCSLEGMLLAVMSGIRTDTVEIGFRDDDGMPAGRQHVGMLENRQPVASGIVFRNRDSVTVGIVPLYPGYGDCGGVECLILELRHR